MNQHTKSIHAFAYLALAAVCLFWGTTYLAIRIGLETIPPAYLLGVRYVLSGSILLIGAAIGGITLPRGRELWSTVLCGVLGIGLGNGMLFLAELRVPSGLTALFYTTAPFWMVGLDTLLPQGKKPEAATVAGLLIGFCGVLYLIYPLAASEGLHGKTLVGFFLLQLSAAAWTLGSLLQKRVHSNAPAFVSGAVQQLGAGAVSLVFALLTQKLPSGVTARSGFALIYLVTFGSILGYSAFIYVVKHLPVAIVSIYYFVNPLVAVLLGWIFFREPFGFRAAIAMLIIFAGIAVVRWSETSTLRTRNNLAR